MALPPVDRSSVETDRSSECRSFRAKYGTQHTDPIADFHNNFTRSDKAARVSLAVAWKDDMDVAIRNMTNGFTLLELIVTMAVAALLLSVGVPSFRNVIMDNRLAGQANEFVTSISTARSAAVRYQRNATICASSNYDAAVPACDAGTDWSNGWIVWVDKNRDSAASADEIISVHEPLGTATLVSTALSQIGYDARGFAVGGGDDLMLCDNRTAETGRLIRVNNVGRTSVRTAACN